MSRDAEAVPLAPTLSPSAPTSLADWLSWSSVWRPSPQSHLDGSQALRDLEKSSQANVQLIQILRRNAKAQLQANQRHAASASASQH